MKRASALSAWATRGDCESIATVTTTLDSVPTDRDALQPAQNRLVDQSARATAEPSSRLVMSGTLHCASKDGEQASSQADLLSASSRAPAPWVADWANATFIAHFAVVGGIVVDLR